MAIRVVDGNSRELAAMRLWASQTGLGRVGYYSQTAFYFFLTSISVLFSLCEPVKLGWKAFGKLDHSQTAFYLISIHEVGYKGNIQSNLLLQKVVFGAADENLTERRVTSQVIPMAIRAFAFVRYDNEATGNTTARNLEYLHLNLISNLRPSDMTPKRQLLETRKSKIN